MNTITNTEDIIDSREVIDRLAELAAQWAEHANDPEAPALDDDERAEMEALTALAREGESLEDWQYGETLVRDSYFVTYAQELADDIGAIKSDAEWPTRCIDWEWAARELRMDYTAIDFAGVTYWAR